MTIQHSNLPLGTAAWKTFQGEDPCFDYGDLWLSRTPDGKAVGLRDKSHVLLTCLTRYGKGTTFIIPNLLLWQGSTVVLDPKGENAIITARRRGHGSCYCGGMGQRVRIFDPYNIVQREDDKFLDLKVRFNPMDPIDPDDPESTDIAAIIADSMVVKGQQSDFWSEAARDLIESIILYVKVSDSIENKDRNLTKVRELLLAGEVAMVEALGFDDNELPTPFEMMFMGMKRTKAFGGLVARAGQHWLEMYLKSERTFFSIVQTASTNTKFLDSAQIQEVVSCSDFELSEIKLDPKGSNIFLSLPQRYMETHFRWLRLMTNLITIEIERTKGQPRNGHQILMVLDEFAGLKSMPMIANAAAQMAGFGLKMMFVVQSLAQLKEHYPRNWETFLANCGTRIFFGNEDHFTRDYVSKLIGEHEVVRVTRSASQTDGNGSSITYSDADSHTMGLTTTTSVTNSSNTSRGGSSGGSNWSYSSGKAVAVSSANSESHTKGRTVSNGKTDNHSDTAGESETIHKRRLLNPDEVGRSFSKLHDPFALILIPGEQPLALRRTAYFEDCEFRGKFDPHPDHAYPKSLATSLTELHVYWQGKAKQLQTVAQARIHAAIAEEQRAQQNERRATSTVSRLNATIKQKELDVRNAFGDGMTIAAMMTFIGTLLFFLPTAFLGYLIKVDDWFPFWEMVGNFPILSASKFAYYLIIGLFWEMITVVSVIGLIILFYVITQIIEFVDSH